MRKSNFFLIPACTGKAGLYDEPLLKMSERETILLDALLEAVIDSHAFRAVLDNGHVFTAYLAVRDRGKSGPETGARIKVEMSPYNMSAGRIRI
jgi:translation initiation factor IF-1